MSDHENAPSLGKITDFRELLSGRPTAPEPSDRQKSIDALLQRMLKQYQRALPCSCHDCRRDAGATDGAGTNGGCHHAGLRQLARALGGSPQPPAGDEILAIVRALYCHRYPRATSLPTGADRDHPSLRRMFREAEAVRAALRGGRHQPEEAR